MYQRTVNIMFSYIQKESTYIVEINQISDYSEKIMQYILNVYLLMRSSQLYIIYITFSGF